ncbi:MAG: NAD-dependent epimerase/dehydratase family protein [Bryobacteraceae bacterium]|nr:NAD-dependent epimerase/dehydratase family protein [Bryobacteraceae bacterium]
MTHHKVLVTGAEGCIGAWVTKQLLEAGAEVITYDLTAHNQRLQLIAPDLSRGRLHHELGRIEDTARLKSLVKDSGITHIVHLAAVLMPYCQANPVSGGLINVIGTLNVFEAARDAGRAVRISYASSSAVWGPEDLYENRKLNEQDSPLPSTHYGIFKHANESSAMVFYKTNGISSFALRPWTVYGPGRDGGLTAAPTLALQQVARGESYTLPVSGPMDLQYVEDVAAAFVAGLFADIDGAHVCNLAGEVIDMRDFVTLVEEIRPRAKGTLAVTGPRVPVANRMDDTLLNRLIPGLPKTPVADGIRRTLAVYER